MNKINKIISTTMILSIIASPLTTKALTKDETIYSVLDKNGSLYKTTVVNHLYGEYDNEIEDTTKLKEILNINGKETFTLNGEKLNWKNNGKEIFYQGTIEKELPIETEVKYYLDNELVDSKDLKGKSGKIKIEISFKNTDSHSVYVNGRQETMYTPFVVTLGTILSNKNASNIEVTNGKVVNTGSKNFLVALSSPGLYESLDMEEFKDMDKITITYDTDSYKEMPIYIVATPKLMESDDLKIFDKLDNIYDNIDSLQTNMNTIESGSKEILEQLEAKINTMSSSNYQAIDEETMNKIKSLAVSSTESTVSNQEETLKREVINTLKNSSSLNPSTIAKSALSTVSSENADFILKYPNTCNSTVTNNYKNEILYNTTSQDQTLLAISKTLGSITEQTPQEYYETITKTIALQLIEGCDVYNTAYSVSSQELEGLTNTIPDVVYNAVLEASTTTASSVSTSVATSVSDTFTKETVSSLKTLEDALSKLTTGISSYNNQGIKVLSGYANSAKNITNKLEALSDLTSEYKGFGSDDATTTTFVSVIK